MFIFSLYHLLLKLTVNNGCYLDVMEISSSQTFNKADLYVFQTFIVKLVHHIFNEQTHHSEQTRHLL